MHLGRRLQPLSLAAHRDRRRSPRIDVRDQVRGTLTATGTAVCVLDLSYGGCLVSTAAPFEVGSLQQLTLETENGTVSITLTVRVVHSRRADGQQPVAYLAGCRFLAPRTATAAAEFDRLMDALTDVLSFDIESLDDDRPAS